MIKPKVRLGAKLAAMWCFGGIAESSGMGLWVRGDDWPVAAVTSIIMLGFFVLDDAEAADD